MTTPASSLPSPKPCGPPDIVCSRLTRENRPSKLVSLLPDVDLLVTNTRLSAVDGPELMQRARVMHPGLPILHVIHGGDSGGGTPPGVPTLREPFTADQLLSVVGRLMAGP
jgi:hypothetical protein